MTDEERKALVERIRKEASIQLGFDGPVYMILTVWADQIEADGQRIAELEAALKAVDDMWSDDGEGGRVDPSQARSGLVRDIWKNIRGVLSKKQGDKQ
jgi:hypothetical protein